VLTVIFYVFISRQLHLKEKGSTARESCCGKRCSADRSLDKNYGAVLEKGGHTVAGRHLVRTDTWLCLGYGDSYLRFRCFRVF
jgi:hypothetical protein